jgi:hypothetical protein
MERSCMPAISPINRTLGLSRRALTIDASHVSYYPWRLNTPPEPKLFERFRELEKADSKVGGGAPAEADEDLETA